MHPCPGRILKVKVLYKISNLKPSEIVSKQHLILVVGRRCFHFPFDKGVHTNAFVHAA